MHWIVWVRPGKALLLLSSTVPILQPQRVSKQVEFACEADAAQTLLAGPTRAEEALSLPTVTGVNDAGRDSTNS